MKKFSSKFKALLIDETDPKVGCFLNFSGPHRLSISISKIEVLSNLSKNLGYNSRLCTSIRYQITAGYPTIRRL